MIRLKNERLSIGILEAAEVGSKWAHWDRAAFIGSIMLDGVHEFAAHEPKPLINPVTGDELDHWTGGIGLCSEITSPGIWESAGIGEPVPKFGVGLVVKTDEGRYKPYLPREIIPFEVSCECKEDSVTFMTAPLPCRGFALEEKKTVSLKDTSVTISYVFKNAGEKPLMLSEYVHNFLTVDDLPIGEEYSVEFPSAADLSDKRPRTAESTVYGKGKTFTFSGYPDVDQIIHLTRDDLDPGTPFSWKMTHAGSPAWICEEDSFIPSRVPFWSFKHVISAEVNHSFTISPGESCAYTRRWTVGD